MTITPIAFTNAGVDLASDADLRAWHPDMDNNRWKEETTYRDIMVAVFNRLLVDLDGNGFISTLISNSAANQAWFKSAVVYGSLSAIFLDFRAELNDRWDLLNREYHLKYKEMVQNAKLDYDTDESGTVDTTEVATRGQVVLLR